MPTDKAMEVSQMSSPSKKRKRRSSKAGAAEKRQGVDGRTVRYSATPSQKIRERIERALPGSGHRMYLLDRKTVAPVGSAGGPIEEFAVLGATANVYRVRIGRHPSCSCPDAAKGNVCKHVLYCMIRVLRLRPDDPLVWQKALLTGEAEEVLSGTRSTRSEEGVMAASAVCAAYRRMSGGAPEDDGDERSQAAAPEGGRPIEGDCPICYDDMQPGGTTTATRVTTCEACGNHCHEECFQQWTAQKRAARQEVTCVYCRCAWPEVPSGGGGAYINLKALSAEHRTQDISLGGLYGESARWISYHQGRR